MTPGHDDGWLETDKLLRQRRQPVVPAIGPARLDRYGRGLGSGRFDAPADRINDVPQLSAGRIVQEAHDDWPLLRVAGQRPCGRAAENAEKLPSFHRLPLAKS